MTKTLLTSEPHRVKDEIVAIFSGEFDRLMTLAESGSSARDVELEVLKSVFRLGRAVLAALMAVLCRRCTEQDLEQRGLSSDRVKLRLDKEYWAKRMTTLGSIHFPLFAYRERRGAATVTRTPAREEVLPAHRYVRSSELCLEWECRLGSEFPFRRAQEALRFFTHGEVSLEDNTIAAHMVAIGGAVDRRWLYKSAEEIRNILRERAERDEHTGRPVVYASTDAHVQRRYVDDTWAATWKCVNGIRLWCVDRLTGRIIHLGGEYTWGDCHEVGRVVDRLVAEAILPKDGDYGDGLVSLLVVITDGLPWIEEHFIGRLPWARPVLDLYHALECLGRFAAAVLGKGTRKANALYKRLSEHLLPRTKSESADGRAKKRRGHNKSPKGEAHRARRAARQSRPIRSGFALLDALYAEAVGDEHAGVYEQMLRYFENNAYRMDYDILRSRGLQIGSGAMESLHRTAGQLRLKLPGARWLQETSQAVFNLRMLHLVERWAEFWNEPNLLGLIVSAFRVRR